MKKKQPSRAFIQDCLDLLAKATGERVPTGKTYKDPGLEYHAFASHGYRNADVVNSMIAFAVRNPEFPCYTQSECDEFVRSYKLWACMHVAEEDLNAVKAKADVVVPYIHKYRQDPERYIIDAPYWNTDNY